jgi:hypothetical protein
LGRKRDAGDGKRNPPKSTYKRAGPYFMVLYTKPVLNLKLIMYNMAISFSTLHTTVAPPKNYNISLQYNMFGF